MVFLHAKPRRSAGEKAQLTADVAEPRAFRPPEEPRLTDQPAEPEEKVQAAVHEDARAERLLEL